MQRVLRQSLGTDDDLFRFQVLKWLMRLHGKLQTLQPLVQDLCVLSILGFKQLNTSVFPLTGHRSEVLRSHAVVLQVNIDLILNSFSLPT